MTSYTTPAKKLPMPKLFWVTTALGTYCSIKQHIGNVPAITDLIRVRVSVSEITDLSYIQRL